jgi:hypothetical protein
LGSLSITPDIKIFVYENPLQEDKERTFFSIFFLTFPSEVWFLILTHCPPPQKKCEAEKFVLFNPLRWNYHCCNRLYLKRWYMGVPVENKC